MLRIIKFLIYCVVLAVAAGFIYFYFKSPAKADVETGKARINEIESMVRLCAVDIYSEIPVLDTINDKVIFGIQKQSGSISFDLEKLNADTLVIRSELFCLPKLWNYMNRQKIIHGRS